MQPGFLVVILALEAQWVGNACLARRVGDDLSRGAPGLVLRRPCNLAGLVGQLLGCAEVVALVPRDGVERPGGDVLGPQRILIDVVVARVVGLAMQGDGVMAHSLGQRYEGAGLVQIVRAAVRPAFPRQLVAVPAIERDALGGGRLDEPTPQRVVDVLH
ncbi:hypothetical protein D3C72_1244520 [compost metagenome]